MARGSSQSQASSASISRPGLAAPRGSAAASAGMRRRRLGSASSSVSSSALAGGGPGSNMLRFYTDDSPGLKISPTVVLIMSLCFIGFVAVLHVIGKFYRVKSGS
ncbi:UNVERIFIED_CONTAM: protein transport protein Sec61 subunit beta [Sesamum radiatum]|uniref:Protein transport protein Sec61 subunit beta n=1 Tax=Sesamum radiatum TaxID=300843 RepID=A0AAW2W445_SESRA